MKDPEFRRSPSKLRLSDEPAAGSVDILAITGTPKEPEVGRCKVMVWFPESAGILYTKAARPHAGAYLLCHAAKLKALLI